MLMENLFVKIKTLKNNNKEFEVIIIHFKNTVNILIRKYNLESHYNDILYHLWNILKKIDLNKFNTENDLHKYISRSLKRYCLDICNKKNRDKKIIYNSEITNIKLNLMENSCSNYLNFEFNDLISILPENQRKILYMKFFEDMKECDIAKKLHMSRQAVYKNKVLALKKLEPIVNKLINI